MLEILTKKHSEWMSMAMSICRDKNLAKDLVQDMYLRLNRYIDNPERIMKNDEVNSFFVYITLRNLFYDYKKDKNNNNSSFEEYKSYYTKDSDETVVAKFATLPEDTETDDLMEEAYHKISEAIYKEVSTWHWYDEKLFKLYFLTDNSLRDIAKDTKISLTSIYNSCKNYKKIIEEKFGEDIEDFFNEDYDKI
jgi:RNA polymerase sigma factor (sigma-70 family)